MRRPHSLPTLREERGGVELSLRVSRVPALSHGEIPQRPLLVAACAASSLLLGRDLRRSSGLSWSDAVIVADAASAWRDGDSGDGGLGGDGCHRANKGSRQGLQLNLTTAPQLQRQQESW